MKQLNWYQIFGNTHKIPDGATVLPTDDIQIWLHCANIWDKAYTTLAEVLADTDTLSALIASNNAVDYMVRSTTWCGNSAASVPTMTSNTAPSGECIGSTKYSSNFDYYKAFDGSDSSLWSAGTGDSVNNSYLGYKFASPQRVTSLRLASWYSSPQKANIAGFKLQGKNDGSWSDIYSVSNRTELDSHYTFDNDTAYQYYRILITQLASGASFSNGDVCVETLQFFQNGVTTDSTAMSYIGLNNYCANTLLADSTWCNAICNSEYFESVLNVKVPVMTSNNTPSGEAFASTNQSSHPAWHAFDDNASSYWHSNSGQTQYIGYTFTEDIRICKVVYSTYNGQKGPKTSTLQGSADNLNWTDIGEFVDCNSVNMKYSKNYNNTNSYRHYRLYITETNYYWSGTPYSTTDELQFYGRKDV